MMPETGPETSVHIINESIICHTCARPAGVEGEVRETESEYAEDLGSPQGHGLQLEPLLMFLSMIQLVRAKRQ